MRKKSKNLKSLIAGLVLMASLPQSTLAQSNSTDNLRGPIDLNKPKLETPKVGEVTDLANDTDTFDPKQIRLSRPELSGLITITDKLNPFNLDAKEPTKVSLEEILRTCIAKNLDIGIAKEKRSNQGWMYTASLSKFLPDINLSYSYNGLKGTANLPIGPNPDPLRFNNPFILTSAGFTYFGYRGGSTLFGALKERNNYRASKHGEKQTIDNALNQAYSLYYRLLLEESILRIRVKAVEVSKEQVKLNKELFEAGSATQLDVMQADTQLSEDRQELIEQQIKRRQVAIDLCDFLNVRQDQDLIPKELWLRKKRLIDEQASIGLLVARALTTRPILKQRNEEYRAAKKQIVVAQAPLHPVVKLDGNVFGIGETLSRQTRTVVASTPVVTPGGGVTNVLAPRSVNRQISALYQIGLSVNWKFGSLGAKDLAMTQAARVNARQALLKQKKEVNSVISQVRQSYLNILRTDRQIEEALAQLRAAKEEIKLARLRYENGLGKNIDILRAQRDYTNALIRKATAIVEYNIAQANLLKDIGYISTASLTANIPSKLN